MRKTRVKFLWNLIKKNDPNLLISIRGIYGDKTKDMEEHKIYEIAKKLWSRKIPERKLWGIV
jgi:hypothetical protein